MTMMSSKRLLDSLERLLVTINMTAENTRSLAEEETGVAKNREATANKAGC